MIRVLKTNKGEENMNKIDETSLNIEHVNIEKLKALFPVVVTEGKIDFDMLRTILGDEIDTSKEKYQFVWNGKSGSIKTAQSPSSATLRPNKEKSVNWNTTSNLYIEGDNLEVLKQLQKTYYGRIKVIYIDPPYNTGNDFVYKDDYKDSIANYKAQTNQMQKSNPETSGRYHSDWLNMIYPRLILSRNLLTEDGVIFVSIGQAEIDNTIKLMNEVFGESNRIGTISRVMKSGSAQGQFFSPNIEYICVYCKNVSQTKPFRQPLTEEIINKLYTSVETEGVRAGEKYRPFGLYQSSLDPLRGCVNQRYYIEAPDGSLIIPPGNNFPEEEKDGAMVIPKTSDDKVWRWSRQRYEQEKAAGNIVFKESKGVLVDSKGRPSCWNVYSKIWLNDRQEDGMVPVDLITKWENRQSKKELHDLDIPFDFAKPVDLLKYLIDIVDNTKESIILDFFSGSASTAHAVMKLNADDNGKRKFIMVQLPEQVPDNSEASKSGYKTICEIGEERIRRAGIAIKKELDATQENMPLLPQGEKYELDIGFKVFTLDSTNIVAWDNINTYDENSIYDLTMVFKSDRTNEDILYEIMLKYGVFDQSVSEISVNEKTLYRIGLRHMIVCLDDEINRDDIDEIIKLTPKVVVFKESGFKTDNDKINAEYNLKNSGVEEVKCI